jgi:hypothetical protein
MTDDISAIRIYFEKLGLNPEVATLYVALHAYGPQNLMQLSRNSGIERTRIYRLIDSMAETNLIEIETEYKRNIFKAAPLANLQILLSKKEQELRHLENELQDLGTALDKKVLRSPATRVQFYKGIDGIKQMLWNETKGTTENLAILYENMQGRTNSAFFERWVSKCNNNNITFRGIIGDHFIATQQAWYSKHTNERIRDWQSRHLPDTILPITHSTITYDDVVAYYNWKDGEIFGIELYNAEIAQYQRHLFALLWSQAIPVDDLKGLEPKPAGKESR